MVWHQSICASLNAVYMAKNTKHWAKAADVEVHPIIVFLCLVLSNPVHLGYARKQIDRGTAREEAKSGTNGPFFPNC